MKLLCLCSTLDFRYRYGCTPAWWQLFKALHERGIEVIAVPYQGTAIESPWWRIYDNPCEIESKAVGMVKRFMSAASMSIQSGATGTLSKTVVENWVRPRWEALVGDILQRERDIAAVLVMGIPLNHLSGMPAGLSRRFKIPFIYYDGDTPASLPKYGGFASGFKIYEGASLSEYEQVICNSQGSVEDLKSLGAKNVAVLHWGVDPELYAPIQSDEVRDVFFYGYGSEYREKWMEAMLGLPSKAMPDARFAAGGQGFKADLGNTKALGDVPFSVFRNHCCASRINLNITRDAHATVFASSSMRPFELAAMGCCIVSNPVVGIETWFEPGVELLVVQSADEAIDTYRQLLSDAARRKAMGEAARRRVLAQHTHRHRADELLAIVHGLA